MSGKRLVLVITQVLFFLGWSGLAGTAKADSLAQIIEGAKKEGTVSVKLASTLAPKGIKRLEREIQKRFGVDLNIQFTPTGSFGKELGEFTMEHKVRMTPTYDLITSSEAYIAPGIKDGVFQRVDWKPFFTEDTNPEMALEHPLVRGSVVNYTGYLGLMINPEKVPAGEFPKAWADLANPKWQGKVGMLNVASTYARWAYVLGKEKMAADLRAVVKNKPIIGRYADQLNRYLLGEVWMGFVTSSYTQAAKEKGVPVVFQGLDFVEEARYLLALRTGAAHPNAAKLVAVYLSTPAGAKFMLEAAAKGNSLYPGNFEHDLRKQLEAQGATIYARTAYPGLLEFLLSKEFAKWEKEMNLILKGTG